MIVARTEHSQDTTQGHFLKRSKVDLNSETSCHTKAKGADVPYYLPKSERRDKFVPFPGALAQSGKQMTLSKIWTRVRRAHLPRQ